MTSILLQTITEDEHHPWAGDLNPLIEVATGMKGGGILLAGHDGTRRDNALTTNYALDVSSQAVGGLHAAFPLKATASGVAKTPANSVLLVRDASIAIGAGKTLSLYDAVGVDHADLTSDADGGLVLGGSGANAGTFSGLTDLLLSGNLAWKSGTAFKITLDHAATADRVITVPDATDTLALLAAAQTLTNKTLTTPAINGATLSGALSGTPDFSGAATFSGLTWTAFTPGLTQNGVRTVTVNYARYMKIGKQAVVQVLLTCTNAGSAGFSILLTGIPAAIQPAQVGQMAVCGTAMFADVSAVQFFVGAAYAATTTTIEAMAHNTVGISPIGATPSYALANGDFVAYQLAYETV